MLNTQKILALLLLLMTLKDGNKAGKFTQFKLIRGNGNTHTSENIKRNEDLEYPRKNGRILRVLDIMWQNYYACLQEKEKQETKPEIHRLLEGQNTEFKCDFCPRPFQNYEEIQWKYKPLSPEANTTTLEYLDLTPEMSLTTTRTLQIFNAVESFAGLYVCFHGKNVLSVYILEVSKNDTTKKVDKMHTNEEKLKKFGNNFYVYYQWTDYTECSTCGIVGKKFKYGTCYLSSIPNPDGKCSRHPVKCARAALKSSKNFVSTKKHIIGRSLQTKINRRFTKGDNSTSQTGDQSFVPDVVEKFSNGIPCASPHLMKIDSDFLKNFTAVKVIVKYCWESCQENNIFEVVDSSGKVVEIANNSAGIYSLFQKLPNIPLGIERRIVVAEFGSSIIILCPGTLRTNTPVIWKVNDKIIYPEIIKNKSNERFTVDLVNRIHIKRLRLRDSQIYSCWQKGRLAGTVHLNVEKKFKIGFNHHVTLIGIIAIIGTFLTVGSKILTRELKMRKK